MNTNVTERQCHISVKHFTGSFFVTEKNYIHCNFHVHDIAFKI